MSRALYRNNRLSMAPVHFTGLDDRLKTNNKPSFHHVHFNNITSRFQSGVAFINFHAALHLLAAMRDGTRITALGAFHAHAHVSCTREHRKAIRDRQVRARDCVVRWRPACQWRSSRRLPRRTRFRFQRELVTEIHVFPRMQTYRTAAGRPCTACPDKARTLRGSPLPFCFLLQKVTDHDLSSLTTAFALHRGCGPSS
jgi:hypothetical protein